MKILAPFKRREIKALNSWQSSRSFVTHPFTCCSHNGCNRQLQKNEGALIPRRKGWVCPCGKWKQNWCHSFMIGARRNKKPTNKLRFIFRKLKQNSVF